jgi:hypothetical protein
MKKARSKLIEGRDEEIRAVVRREAGGVRYLGGVV